MENFKFFTFNLLLPATCFGHSFDHQQIEKLQVQKKLHFYTFIITLDYGQTSTKLVVGSNKQDVEKFKCCDCMDWTVSDL
jgi:hypothetical protein